MPRIQALGPDWVGAVDAGNREAHTFFDHNKLLYAPLDEIRKVHDEVRERYDYEVQKRAGGDLGLDDPPPPLTAETLRERFGKANEKFEKRAGGSSYYIGEEGRSCSPFWFAPRSSREASSPRASSAPRSTRSCARPTRSPSIRA